LEECIFLAEQFEHHWEEKKKILDLLTAVKGSGAEKLAAECGRGVRGRAESWVFGH
jgi:hypothetical protein